MITVDYQHCTGCRACEQICPQHCISMTLNEDGFLYPEIDQAKCIGCNLCEQRCPFHLTASSNLKQPKVYAAYLNNQEELLQSSSGGAFSAIANYVLGNGGLVYGCEFNQKLKAVHVCIHNPEELGRLRGSKYVQSNTQDTFSQAKQYLEKGVPVLYTGTPCQIAGLKAFLHKDYKYLITVDLVCHGVPSPGLFKEYINWLEQKIHGEIISYNFRDKVGHGWGLFGKASYTKADKILHKNIIPILDPYYSLFLNGAIYRQCCYECQYAVANREGDFTIGDFWGIEHIYSELPIQNGISLLMVNSPKALFLLPKIAKNLSLVETTFEQAAKENHQLMHPTVESEKRDAFINAAREEDFSAVIRLWRGYYRREIILARVKYMIPKKIKIVLKKFLKHKKTI